MGTISISFLIITVFDFSCSTCFPAKKAEHLQRNPYLFPGDSIAKTLPNNYTSAQESTDFGHLRPPTRPAVGRKGTKQSAKLPSKEENTYMNQKFKTLYQPSKAFYYPEKTSEVDTSNHEVMLAKYLNELLKSQNDRPPLTLPTNIQTQYEQSSSKKLAQANNSKKSTTAGKHSKKDKDNDRLKRKQKRTKSSEKVQKSSAKSRSKQEKSHNSQNQSNTNKAKKISNESNSSKKKTIPFDGVLKQTENKIKPTEEMKVFKHEQWSNQVDDKEIKDLLDDTISAFEKTTSDNENVPLVTDESDSNRNQGNVSECDLPKELFFVFTEDNSTIQQPSAANHDENNSSTNVLNCINFIDDETVPNTKTIKNGTEKVDNWKNITTEDKILSENNELKHEPKNGPSINYEHQDELRQTELQSEYNETRTSEFSILQQNQKTNDFMEQNVIQSRRAPTQKISSMENHNPTEVKPSTCKNKNKSHPQTELLSSAESEKSESSTRVKDESDSDFSCEGIQHHKNEWNAANSTASAIKMASDVPNNNDNSPNTDLLEANHLSKIDDRTLEKDEAINNATSKTSDCNNSDSDDLSNEINDTEYDMQDEDTFSSDSNNPENGIAVKEKSTNSRYKSDVSDKNGIFDEMKNVQTENYQLKENMPHEMKTTNENNDKKIQFKNGNRNMSDQNEDGSVDESHKIANDTTSDDDPNNDLSESDMPNQKKANELGSDATANSELDSSKINNTESVEENNVLDVNEDEFSNHSIDDPESNVKSSELNEHDSSSTDDDNFKTTNHDNDISSINSADRKIEELNIDFSSEKQSKNQSDTFERDGQTEKEISQINSSDDFNLMSVSSTNASKKEDDESSKDNSSDDDELTRETNSICSKQENEINKTSENDDLSDNNILDESAYFQQLFS